MSFFTDFVIAGKDEAEQIAATPNPTKRWFGFDRKNLASLDAASLYATLIGINEAKKVVDLLDEFEHFAAAERESVDVYKLPAAFVGALAAIDPNETSRIAEVWQSSGNGPLLYRHAEMQKLLDELCALARKASDARKVIFMCVTGY